jgi:hypothetical protein
MTREQAVARILAYWSDSDPNLAAGQWSLSQKIVLALEALDLINLIEPGNEEERRQRFGNTADAKGLDDPNYAKPVPADVFMAQDYIGKRDRT